MPWHAVQFLRMTSQTGPSGLSILGRVARFPTCPAKGKATSIAIVRKWRMHLKRKRLGARAERFLRPGLASSRIVLRNVLDAVFMEQSEQHIGGALRVVRKHDVAVSLERSVQAAQQDHGNLDVGVPVRVPHIAALIYKDVIEHGAVTIRNPAQLFG